MSERDTSGITIMARNQSGHPTFVTLPGASTPPTTASTFATGCIAIANNGKVYINSGSYDTPAWSAIGYNPFNLSQQGGYFTIAVATNSTTAVDVFGSAGAPCALTVTSVLSIAKDTTASNISLKQASNTVATIAKGTTSGGVVGAASLSNITYAAGDACQVVSSGSGNSFVKITFQIA